MSGIVSDHSMTGLDAGYDSKADSSSGRLEAVGDGGWVEGGLRCEECAKAGPVGVDEEDFQQSADEAGDNAGYLKQDVEEQDVDQDGAEEHEADGNKATHQQQ